MLKDEKGKIIPKKEDLEQFLRDRKLETCDRETEVCLTLERAFVDEFGENLTWVFDNKNTLGRQNADGEFAKSSLQAAWSVLWDAVDALRREFNDTEVLQILMRSLTWMQEDMLTIFFNWEGLWKKSRRAFGPICERKPGEDFHDDYIYFS